MGVPFKKVNYSNQEPPGSAPTMDPDPDPGQQAPPPVQGHTVNYTAMGTTSTQGSATVVASGGSADIDAMPEAYDVKKITLDIEGCSYSGSKIWQSQKAIASLNVVAKTSTLTAVGQDDKGLIVDGDWS
jgi:hypothetical protein